MLAIAAVHVGLVSLVIVSSRSVGQALPLRTTLAAFDIRAAPPKADAPAVPAPKAAVTSDRLAVRLRSLSALTIAPPVGGTGIGQGCAMGDKIMAAITSDPLAMQALADLPAETRSEADAVMLWNGDWLGSDVPDPASPFAQFFPAQAGPVDVLKSVVIEAVAASTPECQMATTAGPQLIPIGEADRTTMLVIGSGIWAWASLLSPPVNRDVTAEQEFRG